MANLSGPLTLSNPFTRFDLLGDKELFYSIVSDMIEHGGELAPSDHWNWKLGDWHAELPNDTTGYTAELFDRNYSQLKMMLNPWIGITGMKLVDEDSVARYECFLRSVEHLGLLPDDILSYGRANGWRETDLGTVMDVNLIRAFSDHQQAPRIAVCEVGGGYGRLAEVLMMGLWDSMHYVLVDAVPGSLMYAYLYVKTQLPHLQVGAYFKGDRYHENYDCYIMPAWHSHLLGSSSFDICVNIESMQEMEQHHVDYYLKLFDRLTTMDGQIYLSNARDYVFKGKWAIPNHWETVFLNNTPRSWTADHPTHILHKKSGDFSKRRSVLEGIFKQQVECWHKDRLIAEQKQHLSDRDRICAELQQTINSLNGESTKSEFPQAMRRILSRFIR
ncbi:MAG: putative sugar O-methyltransferase [Candidatus Nitrospira kreftii]|mgnify:CR=1 FL=1|uniref:Putative sugar O-methyltransferase n=1 Tax=Candidatus Nitrospira kreftii TaxID=2652173 RepID=A0A7S8FCS3_9BACT|nr:MAG: putative sugar O-methyltransferase [Candidatus Nitrospira kreftii]